MRRGWTTLVAVAVLASVLFADDPPKPGKCATCDGTKQVKCFSCGARSGAQVPCPGCPDGAFACPGCHGTGTLQCPACGGVGKAGVDKLKCLVCNGGGKLDCLLCDKGKIKCARCKGTGKVPLECPTCSKSGHFRCPDCSGYAKEAKCPACNGTHAEKCPACGGSGDEAKTCERCLGYGVQPCNVCYGHGRAICPQCGGVGKYRKGGGDKMTDKCDTCSSKGWMPCSSCKGKGAMQCEACKGKPAGKVPCWWCAGQKTIPCRRCAQLGTYWTGKEERTGVVLTVFPCQDLEPQFALGLKATANLADFRVWRVIVDGRQGTAPFQLGGQDGYQISGVLANDAEAGGLDPAGLFAPETQKTLERRLPTWGAAPDSYSSPFKLPDKGIGVRLWISDRSLVADAKAIRLRLRSDSSVATDLLPQPLTVDAWIAINVAAAQAQAPPKKK